MLPLLNVKEPFFDAEEHSIEFVCVCVCLCPRVPVSLSLFVSVCSYTGVCYSLSADTFLFCHIFANVSKSAVDLESRCCHCLCGYVLLCRMVLL